MGRKKTIAIIDDEQDIRDLLKDHLEDRNYKVELFADGVSALEHFKKDIPDLILIDLLLPKEHGVNIVHQIKETYFIPIIIISGIYKEKEFSSLLKETCVEGFFEKPFDLKEIDQKINDILNE